MLLYDYSTGAVLPPGNAEFEMNRAIYYFELAAIKEKILPELRQQMEIIINDENQSQFTDTYEGQMRALLYAAAFCAIGDDTAAGELLEKYGAEIYENGDDLTREIIETVLIYVQTSVDPPSAFKTLVERTGENGNKYYSDVFERVNFLKKAVPVTGAVSEVSYTLNGVTETVKLTNFDFRRLEITAEQYKALNISRVSGATDVRVSFTGSPLNLRKGNDTIEITKEVESRGDDGMYYVRLTVKEKPGTAAADRQLKGGYTIYDRVPSNMRFLGASTLSVTVPGNSFALTTSEGQRVRIWARNDGKSDTYTYEYQVMRISDAEAVTPKAYISRDFNLESPWGSNE